MADIWKRLVCWLLGPKYARQVTEYGYEFGNECQRCGRYKWHHY